MKSNISGSKYLSSTELKELALASKDIIFFSTFIYVIHAIRGKVQFSLYPYQKSVVYQFLKQRFNIILKFRQAGITELISMYCLWLAMYHPNKKIHIISIKDIVAKKVLKKIKFMYKNLPDHLKTPVINGRSTEIGTSTELEFCNGSIITSIPTTEDAGRSESLSLLVIDEAAIVRWASSIWAAAFPTLSTGGSAIINSCITGDTNIVGKDGNFRVDTICPKKFGKMDISHLGLKVLTHTGKWQRVIGSVNKGLLETWEIKNKYGDVLKCTPHHKLYTSSGWRTVKDIIANNEQAIFFDTGLNSVNNPPITNPPKKEIIKDIPGNSVIVSELTLVRKYMDNIYDICVENDESYITDTSYISHNTPYGVGNFYHGTWVDAISGGNGFNAIRLYWQMHPERDQTWYDDMSSSLGAKRTAQEIDGDFLSSGNPVFDLTDIKAIEDSLSEYPPIATRFNGQYREFNEPDVNSEYFIGGDCSTGRSTDYSSFTCMDKPGEEAAVYKGRIPLDKFALLMGNTGKKFNYACLAPESNDIGIAVTLKLQDEAYPNLYYSTRLLKKKGKHKAETEDIPGWYTTSKNRSVIIEGLEKDVREDNCIIKDPFFVQEAYTFIYDGMGRPVAMGKHQNKIKTADIDLEGEVYADDDIIGKAITNHIRKGQTRSIIIPSV